MQALQVVQAHAASSLRAKRSLTFLARGKGGKDLVQLVALIDENGRGT